MALRLRIVSEHARRLGSQASKVFGVHGGTIGRANDNDWILPDTERFLSAKHVRVEFRAGTYYLHDTSSNGVYINGAQAPLGKSNERELQDGDYLRLGEFELLVSIDANNDFPLDDGAVIAYEGPSRVSAAKKATADDIGSSLDLIDLLEPSGRPPGGIGLGARDAYGQAIVAAPEETPWHMMTRPLKVQRSAATEARLAEPLGAFPNRQKSPVFHDADIGSGVAALCRGAGIDAQSLSPEARAGALQICGSLLREVALGFMELAQSRKEFRHRFRISSTTAPEKLDQDFFNDGVDEALIRLLMTTNSRGGAVDSIRDSFQEIKAQQAAMLGGMHAAFEEFLARLDPKDLGERFDRGAKRGVFGAQNTQRHWELYTELFNTLAQRPNDGFPHLFVETFARAYEAKLSAVAPAKRSFGTGSDAASESDFRAVGDS